MTSLGRRGIIRLLGAAAFLLALALLAYRHDVLERIWHTITGVSAVTLIGALALFGAARLVQALCFRQTLLIFGERLSVQASLQLSGIKGFYNLTFQGAGILAQAASGRAKSIFKMRSFIASTLLQSLFLALAIGLSVAMLSFALPGAGLSQKLALLLGSIVTIAVVAVVFACRRYRLHASILSTKINDTLLDIHELLSNARASSLIVAAIYQMLFGWLRLARFVFIAVLLSSEVNIIELSAIVLAADFVSLLPLTPSGIGLREFLIGTGGVTIGHMEILVAAALVDRGVMILGNLLHGLFVFVGDIVSQRQDN